MPSLRGYYFIGPVPNLDEADRLWRGLCLECEAA